jgi:ATP-dependent helicase/nuclease subunit A
MTDPSSTPRAEPADQDSRDRIEQALDETLFVEAGAGSGKTTALVGRVVALVQSGVPITSIAAITFTEKAATELRDRVRTGLEQLQEASVAPLFVEAALDELDRAAVGTLHGFARRVLLEHPIEAALPPSFEVLDEIESRLDFDEQWRALRETLLADPQHERLLLLSNALGITLDHLRQVAVALRANWDLLLVHPPPPAPDPPTLQVGATLNELLTICAERHLAPPDCKFARCLLGVESWVVGLGDAVDEADRLGQCAKPPSSGRGLGRAPDWQRHYVNGRYASLADLKAALSDALGDVEHDVERVRQGVLASVLDLLARHTVEAAELRRRSGRLVFHDLLVMARGLVRDPAHGSRVRADLHRRYQHLLLDEFQDTDPIQVELAVRIAANPNDDALSWRDLDVPSGRLFFVGDPKQSIYRFRRADITQFLEAQVRFAGERPTTLSTNFRTVEPVVTWVNHVFGRLILAVPGQQPAYVPLQPVRTLPGGPAVTVLGTEAHNDGVKADDLREREAADVATTIRTALAEGWPVYVEHEKRWRPARLGDITVLLPTRLSLAALERALDRAGIPFRAEASSLVYGTSAVRSLLLALRAVDDPTDELAVVASLRSPLFGCSDVDLYRWKVERRGSWHHQAPRPEPEPDAPSDPVADALALLGRLHRDAPWRTPSELLTELVHERRVLELGLVDGRALDLWRRVRFVVDQARAWSDAGGSGLRRYLVWAELQADEGSRVSEAILPETDQDAVRIMTIHAAKGLEFPIAIVAGTTSRPGGVKGPHVAWPAGEPPALHLSKTNTTEAFQAFKPLDEQMETFERLRLLYVACTRARDHLVVSLHRPKDVPASAGGTLAQLLAGADQGSGSVPLRAVAITAPLDLPEPLAELPWSDHEAWAAELDRALTVARRPGTVAATTLARDAFPTSAVDDDAGLDKDARDLELPPWNKGRYGTAIGRAVHAALQSIDLATGEGLADAASAQAAAEGVIGQEGVIEALARSALDAPAVQEAARSPHWREVYVAAPFGDTVLEGYIDLMYRSPEGLVVVDHKTDHAPDDAALDAKMARYRLQGAAYAAALEAVTGEPVVRCVFIFCSPAGARQRDLDDLAGAVADVRGHLVPDAGSGTRTPADV